MNHIEKKKHLKCYIIYLLAKQTSSSLTVITKKYVSVAMTAMLSLTGFNIRKNIKLICIMC